jgi:hypothetical protein
VDAQMSGAHDLTREGGRVSGRQDAAGRTRGRRGGMTYQVSFSTSFFLGTTRIMPVRCYGYKNLKLKTQLVNN